MGDDNESDVDEHELYELAVLAYVPALPKEIQHQIFSFCDLTSRGALCRVNKELHAQVTPLLWRHLDFVEVFEDDQLVEATRKFFVMCDVLMDESPERFATLASYVQTLDVGRLHGVNIVQEEYNGSDFIYFNPHEPEEGSRCVFDVIARFTNLTMLSMYMKNWWGFRSRLGPLEASARKLACGLTKLDSLKLGGQMSTDVLLALLSNAEQIKDLTLINLIVSPGQDSGPDGIAFLSDICQRFTSLETLHLCKLADLEPQLSDDEESDGTSESDLIEEFVSGMRWRFPRESEVAVLQDWASLIHHSSKSLRSLTLENRYLCGHGFERDLIIDPGNTHPDDYGVFSIRESQRFLFPEFSNNEWPQLKKLTLVGMGKAEDVERAVLHLEPQVHVEQRPARIEIMEGDVTPEQISTPMEFTCIPLSAWLEDIPEGSQP
ncbi:hypothetical protein HJFPF1_12667 [Paramyrothecium foliicola]|nr:hypothetical protein HJFPF1_12667 [Paramyrothecium foliicola]